MCTIAFLNQKGGVGKTSLCFHLAGVFARMGRKVLVVDNDPQASLTQAFLGPEATVKIIPAHSVLAAYREGPGPIAPCVSRQTAFAGIDLIPGSLHLAEVNLPIDDGVPLSCRGLDVMLQGVKRTYDLVLIDCPPNLLRCSISALWASDGVIVPVAADDFGTQGIVAVQATLGRVQATLGQVRLLGYLLSRYRPRTSLQRMFSDQLRYAYGSDVFEASVPDLVGYAEAVLERTPVTLAAPKSTAAEAIAAVGTELLTRVHSRLSDLCRVEEVH